MKKIAFFDTETTGLPIWSEPSNSDGQPHLTQLAVIVAHAETFEVLNTVDLTVRPDGWVIPAEVSKLNQLTTEYCADVGVSEKLVLELFLELVNDAQTIVAHNSSFDQRIIRIAMKRYGYNDAALIDWAAKDHFCTMRTANPVMGLVREDGKPKLPNLTEAYQFYTGKTLENAHTAMADTQACFEIYKAMKLQEAEQQEPKINF